MSAELAERRSLLAACRQAIVERDRLFAEIDRCESSKDLDEMVARLFGFTLAQSEVVLNMQARHFSRTNLARLEDQIAAMDAALGLG